MRFKAPTENEISGIRRYEINGDTVERMDTYLLKWFGHVRE